MSGADLDRDLLSVQEARRLGRAAQTAQARLEQLDQEAIDRIVEAMAAAGLSESRRLAEMAVEETGLGKVDDKVAKNDFVLRHVTAAMRGMRTVGVIDEDPQQRVLQIAEPVGVVAGIIPTTNPTSTAIFKCLIALKARCGIVLSPHPKARGCIKATADVMHEAAVAAGAPPGIIGCLTVVTMEGTRELMRGAETDVILATGGTGLVRAAYSAGKPAFGVGPGNVPAYIERSADIDAAVGDIFAGTTFDNGTLCSSEQAIVCDRAVAAQVRAAALAQGGHFLDARECVQLAEVLITGDLMVQPELVGQTAATIAARAGIDIPDGTRVLICPQEGVGPEYPLSREKLSPVLAWYEVEDWRQGCERCKQLLAFGGLGHTLVLHTGDDEIALQFGLHKPASRVLVNTVSAVGAVGLTTGLFPSMTLGCGSDGNNITSDNIGPQHLLNVKRLAWGIRPYAAAEGATPPPATPPAAAQIDDNHDDIDRRVEIYLRRKGIIGPAVALERGTRDVAKKSLPGRDSGSGESNRSAVEPPRAEPAVALQTILEGGSREASRTTAPAPVDFVAEADVKRVIERGGKIRIGPQTIITPLARDLGEQHGIFKRR